MFRSKEAKASGQAADPKRERREGLIARWHRFVCMLGERLSISFSPVDGTAPATDSLRSTPATDAIPFTANLSQNISEACQQEAAGTVLLEEGTCELCGRGEPLPGLKLCAICGEAIARLIAPSPIVVPDRQGPDQRGRGNSGRATDLVWMRQVP